DSFVQSTGVTTEEATATIQDLGIDYSTMSSDELTAALLQAIAAEQDANTAVATPVSTTSNTSTMESITLGINDT
ncbi:hypothetical protein, partial [Staphylococcus capitis]|uniref:hypothetical protein n=1 Tax=Staphylococcus capitis TaxID=29388 RepID=UPI00066C6D02